MQGADRALSCSYTFLFLHTPTDFGASRGGAHWLVPGRVRGSAAASKHAAHSLAGGRERVRRARDAIAGARARHVRARAARRGRAGYALMPRLPLDDRKLAHRDAVPATRPQAVSWLCGGGGGDQRQAGAGCPCNTVADGAPAAGGQPYSAAALSLVFHPAHPHVPTLRADVRRFEARCQCRRTQRGGACLCLGSARTRLAWQQACLCVGPAAAAPLPLHVGEPHARRSCLLAGTAASYGSAAAAPVAAAAPRRPRVSVARRAAGLCGYLTRGRGRRWLAAPGLAAAAT